MKMTVEQALFLLACIRGCRNEGFVPKIGDRQPNPSNAEYMQVVYTLAGVAGVGLDDLSWAFEDFQ